MAFGNTRQMIEAMPVKTTVANREAGKPESQGEQCCQSLCAHRKTFYEGRVINIGTFLTGPSSDRHTLAQPNVGSEEGDHTRRTSAGKGPAPVSQGASCRSFLMGILNESIPSSAAKKKVSSTGLG
jgi:hypothetical protein